MNSNITTIFSSNQKGSGNIKNHPGGSAVSSPSQIPFISGVPSNNSILKFGAAWVGNNFGGNVVPNSNPLLTYRPITSIGSQEIGDDSYNPGQGIHYTKITLPLSIRHKSVAGVVKIV